MVTPFLNNVDHLLTALVLDLTESKAWLETQADMGHLGGPSKEQDRVSLSSA